MLRALANQERLLVSTKRNREAAALRARIQEMSRGYNRQNRNTGSGLVPLIASLTGFVNEIGRESAEMSLGAADWESAPRLCAGLVRNSDYVAFPK